LGSKKTIAEIRESLIQQLEAALKFPTMWGGNDYGIELFFRVILGLLGEIDEPKPDDSQHATHPRMTNPMGLVGQFAAQHVSAEGYECEVASAYAHYSYSLGYWRPARLLERDAWLKLQNALDQAFFTRDWRESEILERFGEPSYRLGGPFVSVVSYGSADSPAEGWIHFDFARKARPYQNEPYLDDPQLRDVRLKDHELRLLPFGRRSRSAREVFTADGWIPAESQPCVESRDIDAVIAEVRRRLPGVTVQRLERRHPFDIFAIWYFSWGAGSSEISLSSYTGDALFSVETSLDGREYFREDCAATVDDAVAVVVQFLLETGSGSRV
jgi:hypothetical protein